MKLSEDVKNKIYNEDWKFRSLFLKDLSLPERQEYCRDFTSAQSCINLIESLNCDSLEGQVILDPCCSIGSILAACLIAGADSDKVLGNDINEERVNICYDRLCDMMINSCWWCE